jgi:LCP family protein required for cell wall assembly
MVLKSISSKSGGVVSFLETIKNPKARFNGKSRVNILLVGKDYNRDSKGMPITRAYFIDPKTGKRGYRNIARADTIVVMSCDLDNGKVSAISIPRDTRVTARDGKTGKINATYARGGSKLLRETVEDLTGITPDYVIAIKPDAIREIVSILGGVDVETIDQMKYDDNWGNLHIDLPKGKQHLTGDQAVGFARFREVKPGTKHSAEEGDARQRQRGGAADQRDHVGVVLHVMAQHGRHDLHLVADSVGKRRTQGAVNQTADQDGLSRGTAFTTEERTGDLACCVRTLFNVYGQREEVEVVLRLLAH